jgi:hypothetical protein
MFEGRAAIGYDHGYDGEIFYLGLALDPAYIKGWVEGCLERIGEDNPEEEEIFRDLWDDETQREVVIESLKADCDVRRVCLANKKDEGAEQSAPSCLDRSSLPVLSRRRPVRFATAFHTIMPIGDALTSAPLLALWTLTRQSRPHRSGSQNSTEEEGDYPL